MFSYVRKGRAESISELVNYINKVIEKFRDNIPLELTDALNEYLKRHPEAQDITVITKEDGTILTLTDIENEINNRTSFGIDYEKALYKMSFEDLINKDKNI